MAGLLDFLSQPAGGGLLDFLRQNALNQQFPSGGAPGEQAQYGQAPLYSPPPSALAPMQANAQMAPAAQSLAQASQPAPLQQPAQDTTPFVQDQRLHPQGFLDTLNQRMQSIGNGGSIIGALTGTLTDPQSQALAVQNQTLSAKFSALRAAGYTPKEAMVGAVDPEAFKSMAPQAFGGEPGKTLEITDPNSGIKHQVEFRDGKWTVINPVGIPSAAPQPNKSPLTAGTPPVGVDPEAWRKAEATRLSEEEKNIREQGIGALDFIPDALRVHQKILDKGENVIGPYKGSEEYNKYVRTPLSTFSDSKKAELSTYNELQADFKRLSTKNLKAQFGGRVTNMEVGLNGQTFGGLANADAATSANILKERIQGAYDNLQKNIDAGLIDPNNVPKEIIAKGQQMGFLRGGAAKTVIQNGHSYTLQPDGSYK